MSIVVQAMSQGAENGAMMHWNPMYNPAPNAYLGGLLFKQYCSECHGSGETLEGSGMESVHEIASEYYVIVYGRDRGKGKMPAFRSVLTQFQIYDILAHLGYRVEDHLNGDYTGFKKE